MELDTKKIKDSGNEIVRLANLIDIEIDEYYQLIDKLVSQAWVGVSADRFKVNCLKYKPSTYKLIEKIKDQGNKFVDLADNIDNQINHMER